jgi:hypothetical protein
MSVLPLSCRNLVKRFKMLCLLPSRLENSKGFFNVSFVKFASTQNTSSAMSAAVFVHWISEGTCLGIYVSAPSVGSVQTSMSRGFRRCLFSTRLFCFQHTKGMAVICLVALPSERCSCIRFTPHQNHQGPCTCLFCLPTAKSNRLTSWCAFHLLPCLTTGWKARNASQRYRSMST